MSQVLYALLQSISFTDVIDIAIVSFIVYKLIGFIRTSRAQQLAKGLFFIVALAVISDVCNFYAVNWILGKVLDIGLIALIVVFQPELRRALEFIGRGSLTSRLKQGVADNSTSVTSAIVSAVEYFSAHKVGALIIFERQTALSDIAESGTVLNAEISEQLLENIFYVGSPMHDGATIIRRDRVYAAGCMLPLTENQNLSKDLGTRHRAGIGITEVSDSLVLIVSEETGIISMAEDGKLSRFLDSKAVEKALLNYYLSNSKPAGGLLRRRGNGNTGEE